MFFLIIVLPGISFLILLVFGQFIGLKGCKRFIRTINLILIFWATIILFEIMVNGLIIELFLNRWIIGENFHINFNFKLETGHYLLVYLILFIYVIVVEYSFWYMGNDPYFIRFIGSLNIFCFMMLILVISGNGVLLFLGWEGVGLTSYILINFWYTRILANRAALKAILYNKIGDIGYLIGLIGLANSYSFKFFEYIPGYGCISSSSNIILFGFIIAAIAKSAQIGLHSWLSDAMEGPTPVSALLHAATMVTAGVYLIMQIFPQLGIINQTLLNFIIIISVLTIILGGLGSLFQTDLKKVIAYSTMSQLGYMLISTLTGFYNYGFFHFISHGAFKGLLFLTSGLLIHSLTLANEQDLRRYGGLMHFLPVSYNYFIIGTLAIIAWPLFTGFQSKELIIDNSLFSNNFIYFGTLLGGFITLIYSIRLILLLFWNQPKNLPVSNEPTSLIFLLLPLVFASIFFGFYFKSIFILPSFLSGPVYLYSLNPLDIELLTHLTVSFITTLIIFPLGLILAIYFTHINHWNLFLFIPYNGNHISILNYFLIQKKIISLCNGLFYWNNIVNRISKWLYKSIYRTLNINIDKGYLEWLGPTGLRRYLNKPINIRSEILKNVIVGIYFGLFIII